METVWMIISEFPFCIHPNKLLTEFYLAWIKRSAMRLLIKRKEKPAFGIVLNSLSETFAIHIAEFGSICATSFLIHLLGDTRWCIRHLLPTTQVGNSNELWLAALLPSTQSKWLLWGFEEWARDARVSCALVLSSSVPLSLVPHPLSPFLF